MSRRTHDNNNFDMNDCKSVIPEEYDVTTEVGALENLSTPTVADDYGLSAIAAIALDKLSDAPTVVDDYGLSAIAAIALDKHSDAPTVMDDCSLSATAGKTLDSLTTVEFPTTKEDPDKKVRKHGQYIRFFTQSHAHTVVSKYFMLRIDEDVYAYKADTGAYELQSDNQLKTLIRKEISEEDDYLLDMKAMLDIVDRIRTNPYICTNYSELDQNTNLLNFKNITLDMAAERCLMHSANCKITSFINAQYIPNLSIKGSRFEKYLQTVTDNDPQKNKHLQEITGYILSSCWKAKKAIVFEGPRNSGKSTYLRVIQELIGYGNYSNFSFSALAKQFVSGKLLRKRVNFFGEKSSNIIKDIEMFKALVGGDWHETEDKCRDFVSRPSRIKLVYAYNSPPNFDNAEDSVAYLDRVTIFRFSQSVPESERIIDMDNFLLEENEIIVSWAIDGLIRLARNGYSFTEADDAVLARVSRTNYFDAIEDFLNTECNYCIDSRVFSKDLHESYLSYCKQNGIMPLEQKRFTQMVITDVNVRGVEYKKIRIGKEGPYMGFLHMNIKSHRPDVIEENINDETEDVSNTDLDADEDVFMEESYWPSSMEQDDYDEQ